MQPDDMFAKLESFGITDKETYFSQVFSRNIGLFTEEEQKRLSNFRIAIPGMGGVGGLHLITLTRTGITKFNIADFDEYEPVNINRQYGARVLEFGRPKIDVMAEQALSINPYLELNPFKEGINASNMDDFLEGVDVVLDGLDFFEFEIRRLLFKRAAEKGIHVITAGPLGYSSAMLVFSPKGMGFDEYFNIRDGMADEDKYLSFALGLSPRSTHIKYMDFKRVDLSSKAGPSLNIACQICAGMVATEAVKVILKKGKIKPVPHYFQYDPFLQTLRKGYLFMGNKNPWQKLKIQVLKKLINKNKPKLKPDIPEKPEIIPAPGKNIEHSVLEYLIRAGIQAPSGDNCQPWKFEIKKNRIDLFLDRDKDHSFFNVNQVASLISCGTVLENIKIAASSLGIEALIKYDPDLRENDRVASIDLIPGETKKDPLADFIWQRHTNRKLFKKTPIAHEILESVESAVDSIPGAQIRFVTERKKLKKLARIIYKIDRIRTEHKPLHEHLMSMIRFTEKEALRKRDGFPLKNLEAGLAGELFLKVTKSWPVMNVANKIGVGRMVALNAWQGTVNSSGAGLLLMDKMDDHGFIQGGRALEKAWLTFASHGIQLQPMTAATLFYLRLIFEQNKTSGFLKQHKAVLIALQDQYHTLFRLSEKKLQAHILLFRFGKGENMGHRTLRPVIEFLIKK
nr:ThiF family adenylyltransferase [uncultured Desulfobacter sp.]